MKIVNISQQKSGFTLTEMIIAISIVAIFVTLPAIAYSSYIKKARDTQRKNDISQIQTALEQYKANVGKYPDEEELFKLVEEGYLPKVPVDPRDGMAIGGESSLTYGYSYVTNEDGSSFELSARLEEVDRTVSGTGDATYFTVSPVGSTVKRVEVGSGRPPTSSPRPTSLTALLPTSTPYFTTTPEPSKTPIYQASRTPSPTRTPTITPIPSDTPINRGPVGPEPATATPRPTAVIPPTATPIAQGDNYLGVRTKFVADEAGNLVSSSPDSVTILSSTSNFFPDACLGCNTNKGAMCLQMISEGNIIVASSPSNQGPGQCVFRKYNLASGQTVPCSPPLSRTVTACNNNPYPTPTPTGEVTPTMPLNTMIVYAASPVSGGVSEIFKINFDGTGKQKLSTAKQIENHYSPMVNPARTLVVFTKAVWPNEAIYTVSSTGTNEKQLTPTGENNYNPVFFDNGTKILYNHRISNSFFIWKMNADGTQKAPITSKGGYEDFLRSPQAVNTTIGKVVFYSDRNAPGKTGKNSNTDLYSINLDGTGELRLTNSVRDDFDAVFSPDGNQIAFVSYRDNNEEIYIMNSDGSGQTNLSNNSERDNYPQFSPDGQYIYFVSSRGGGYNIYRIKTDGTGMTKVTNSAAYSPFITGNRMVYVSGQLDSGDIMWMDLPSGTENRLNNTTTIFEQSPAY